MDVLRTPDDRFRDLPGYAFEPRFVEVDGLRIHYVDEGPPSADPVLMLHGEPSWCYLYRKMIPLVVAAGHRAIAPDLVGFGRSDKLADRRAYSYQFHVDVVAGLLGALDLAAVTLVCQDWGGLIGLRIAAEHPRRFARVVAANTFLPTGDHDPGPAFLAWKKFSQEIPEFPVGAIVRGGCVTELAPEVIAAYDAPFPEERYKEAARAFPLLVPVTPDDPASAANRAAWSVWSTWEKPFLTAFSDSDPITRGADAILRTAIPGAQGQPHVTIERAGHFLQEDRGEELARVVNEFIATT
jgi:haloalkane dehalogenase